MAKQVTVVITLEERMENDDLDFNLIITGEKDSEVRVALSHDEFVILSQTYDLSIQ